MNLTQMTLKMKTADNTNMARREAIVIFIAEKNMKLAKRHAVLDMTILFMARLLKERVVSDHIRMLRYFDLK